MSLKYQNERNYSHTYQCQEYEGEYLPSSDMHTAIMNMFLSNFNFFLTCRAYITLVIENPKAVTCRCATDNHFVVARKIKCHTSWLCMHHSNIFTHCSVNVDMNNDKMCYIGHPVLFWVDQTIYFDGF